MPPESFRPVLSRDLLSLLDSRLRTARLPAGPGAAGGGSAASPGPAAGDSRVAGEWEWGTPAGWLAALVEDWRLAGSAPLQRLVDGFHHVRVDVGGTKIHALVEEGEGADPLPIVLCHGWPGSFLEFAELVPLLTHPSAHGGDAADAFTVVVPSLPGYGFSDPAPVGGFHSGQMAELVYGLMEGLGYGRFVAHGTDIGSGVASRLALRHPEAVAAAHVATPMLPPPPEPWSQAEQRYLADVATWTAAEGAYAHEHATKPATIGAALLDSPVGLASWVGEKWVAWSPVRAGGEPAFDRDLLLATLTLYWVTGTAATALWPYWALRLALDEVLRAGERGSVPIAVTVFGGERVPFPKPPRELAERYFSLPASLGWREEAGGGHFASLAEPRLLAGILRDVFRGLR